MAAPTPITYAQAKSAMASENFPTSAGSAWLGKDAASYFQFAAGACYGKQPFDRRKSMAGFAFAGEMPAAIAAEIGSDNYSAVIAGTPLTGAAPLSVTLTATETGGTATSYEWDFGDGTSHSTTTVNHVTHSYATAGSYTPKMKPTFGGVVKAQVSGAAITVSAPPYSATLAGSPLTGAHPASVVWTLTETNNPSGADSYLWDYGDGTTGASLTTTVPTATHSYAAAGSFTAKVTPTINGVAKAQITAAAPAVIS